MDKKLTEAAQKINVTHHLRTFQKSLRPVLKADFYKIVAVEAITPDPEDGVYRLPAKFLQNVITLFAHGYQKISADRRRRQRFLDHLQHPVASESDAPPPQPN
jgi:hypothetical protein